MKWTQLGSVFLVFVSVSCGGSGEGSVCGADIPATAGGYCTQGNKILDANGEQKVFHGVNRPSLEWDYGGIKLNAADFEEMASWKANVVRLPLNQAFWFGGQREIYKNRVDQVVGWALDAGLHVIIDLHRAPLEGAELNEQQDMTNEQSLEFWKEVAALYKDEPEISFDLYNEPRNITWAQWRNGGNHPMGWKIVGMQQLYDAVRNAGAKNLVLVGGLNWAYEFSGLLDNPLDGYNIIYVTHLYGFNGKRPEDWAEDWLFLKDRYPLMIGEFGPSHNEGAFELEYVEEVLRVADENSLSWTAWAWYNFSTNNLFDENWQTDPPNYSITPYGQLVKDRLATYD